MKILAHRGLWYHESERNTTVAFQRALEGGFGIETDLRDYHGALVVSHDPADANAISAAEFLSSFGRAEPLALNIKSDGVSRWTREAIENWGVKNYFCFDMSVPETLRYLEEKVTTYLRVSEHELPHGLMARASGIWLDYFHHDSWTADMVIGWIDRGLSVCIVSPELHGRPHKACWERIANDLPTQSDHLMICTDLPEAFRSEILGAGERFHG